jgi:hypothetical protein
MFLEDNNQHHWTEKKELLLKQWGLESELYSWLHNYNADYYNNIDFMLSIPAIIISAITSTALFSTLGMDNNRVVIIIFGILLIIGTLLQSLRDFIKVSKLLYDNRHYSKLYQIMANDIDEQLNQEKGERENGIKFLNKIKGRRNDILLNSPTIHNKSWIKLKKSFANGKMIKLRNKECLNNLLRLDKKNENEKKEDHKIINIENNQESNNDNQESNNIDELELDISIEDLKKKIFFFE